MQDVTTITQEELSRRLREETPDNADPSRGFALVNVLGRDAFEEEHIPSSINIPVDRPEEFEQRFTHDKEIVVYCASPECSASPKAARELQRRGFTNVRDFDAGMSEWKAAGGQVASGATH